MSTSAAICGGSTTRINPDKLPLRSSPDHLTLLAIRLRSRECLLGTKRTSGTQNVAAVSVGTVFRLLLVPARTVSGSEVYIHSFSLAPRPRGKPAVLHDTLLGLFLESCHVVSETILVNPSFSVTVASSNVNNAREP